MDAIPFKKPSARALLEALPKKDREAFVADMLDAAISFDADPDAAGYVSMFLYRDGKRSIAWNTVRGSGYALERAFNRTGQEIVKYIREHGD